MKIENRIENNRIENNRIMPPRQHSLLAYDAAVITTMSDHESSYFVLHGTMKPIIITPTTSNWNSPTTSNTTSCTTSEREEKEEKRNITTTTFRKKKKRSNVRFVLAENKLYPIPHVNDMTNEEVSATWYGMQDFDKMKAEMLVIVKRMMKGDKIEETNEVTIRGLEYRTRKGAIRRQHHKYESINAVLDEQDRQIEEGIDDPELLRQVYLEISVPCHYEMNQLALDDAIDAKEYQKEIIIPDDEANDNNAIDHSSHHRRRKSMRRSSSVSKLLQTSFRILSKAAIISPSPSRGNSPER